MNRLLRSNGPSRAGKILVDPPRHADSLMQLKWQALGSDEQTNTACLGSTACTCKQQLPHVRFDWRSRPAGAHSLLSGLLCYLGLLERAHFRLVDRISGTVLDCVKNSYICTFNNMAVSQMSTSPRDCKSDSLVNISYALFSIVIVRSEPDFC